MEIAPMTKRDKILLYVVLMLAFVVLFVRFLLIPGIENHQQADADLRRDDVRLGQPASVDQVGDLTDHGGVTVDDVLRRPLIARPGRVRDHRQIGRAHV